ncbi:hypothetical protein A6P39_003420 [Streptomyces sp. FXJ1.172]|uniref:hypothetical protein n=1 Tax=Streptomyces sp. FXJ1.172 TaxID=710705 RepID=UPI00099FF891|nr:hypothetical protein [Streptomyces sp. FXJ1.172]WEP00498.1 hypothetical protein A6P39_003420 [Streptomyces sp. FXJ1.172]
MSRAISFSSTGSPPNEVFAESASNSIVANEGARMAADDGLLLCGQTALRRLSIRMDRETARAVFKASGLD